MEIVSISSDEITDELWQEYYDLLKKLHHKYKTSLYPANWQDLKKRLLSRFDLGKLLHHALALEKGKPFCLLELVDFGDSGSDRTIYLNLLGDFESLTTENEIKILNWFIYHYEQNSIKEAFCTAFPENIRELFNIWEAVKLSRQDQYYLYHNKINRSVLDDWLKSVPQANPGLKIEFYDELPDQIMTEFVEHLKDRLNAMPEEDTGGIRFNFSVDEFKKQNDWHKKNNTVIYTYLILNTNSRIVASSGVSISRNNPRIVHQLMTGVSPRYQGRGLAKWLKAIMYLKIKEDFPDNEALITEMRAVNDPILHLNKQLGYLLERSGQEYKITIKAIKNRRQQLTRSS